MVFLPSYTPPPPPFVCRQHFASSGGINHGWYERLVLLRIVPPQHSGPLAQAAFHLLPLSPGEQLGCKDNEVKTISDVTEIMPQLNSSFMTVIAKTREVKALEKAVDKLLFEASKVHAGQSETNPTGIQAMMGKVLRVLTGMASHER